MNTYKVENGRIVSPGKFEGCREYVPHFWDIGLDGFADSDDGITYTFKVTKEDRTQFPGAFGKRRTVRLVEDSNGFVNEV